jgi:hypothetical protein
MKWLQRAARLRGKAPLVVALALWFELGRKKGKNAIKLTQSLLARFGGDRKLGYRGLAALETAELVQVERHRGRSPTVTLRDVARVEHSTLGDGASANDDPS